MSLKVRATSTFAALVNVVEPGDVPGEVVEGSFSAWYVYVSPERFAALCDELRAVSSGPDEARFRELAQRIRIATPDVLPHAVEDLVALIRGTAEPVTVSAIYAFRRRLLDEVLVRIEGVGNEHSALAPEDQLTYIKSGPITAQAAMDKFFGVYQDARAGNSPRSAAR